MNNKIEKVEITTDFIKLDSFIKFAGAASTGGMAKGMVQEGLIKVNGITCTMRGKKLVNGCIITVNETDYEVVKV